MFLYLPLPRQNRTNGQQHCDIKSNGRWTVWNAYLSQALEPYLCDFDPPSHAAVLCFLLPLAGWPFWLLMNRWPAVRVIIQNTMNAWYWNILKSNQSIYCICVKKLARQVFSWFCVISCYIYISRDGKNTWFMLGSMRLKTTFFGAERPSATRLCCWLQRSERRQDDIPERLFAKKRVRLKLINHHCELQKDVTLVYSLNCRILGIYSRFVG